MLLETLSVFPQVFAPYLDESIMGRAQRAGIFRFVAHDLRDWTHDRHRTVDDAPFGGGQGMLMKPEPIFEAVEDIAAQGEERPHVVFFSPCGRRFDQACAERLAERERVLFVCGRYEGMDERAYELADEVLSLGDYVLTGGELAALVVIDSVVRLLPGALGDELRDAISDGASPHFILREDERCPFLRRDGLCRLILELGEDALVVATGGMALMIAEESNVIDKLDGLLTLKGLRLIYERNRTETESDGRR